MKTSFACFYDGSGDFGRVRKKSLCVETFLMRLKITGFGQEKSESWIKTSFGG